MSFLQDIVASLQKNCQILEKELGTSPSEDMFYVHKPSLSRLDDVAYLPPPAMYTALDQISQDVKFLKAAVMPNRLLLLEQAFKHCQSAALRVATELGISDAIIELGTKASLQDLAERLNVNANKLGTVRGHLWNVNFPLMQHIGHVMRILAAEAIYVEVKPDVFANTRHSIGLCRDQKARPFLSLTSQPSWLLLSCAFD